MQPQHPTNMYVCGIPQMFPTRVPYPGGPQGPRNASPMVMVPTNPNNPAVNRRVFPPGGVAHPGMPIRQIQPPMGHQNMPGMQTAPPAGRKRKLSERVIPASVRQEFPESESYMQMLDLEKRLDRIIMHKKLSLQESLKKSFKTKHKLRVLLTTNVTNNFTPSGVVQDPNNSAGGCPGWELRMEGKLLDENGLALPADSKNKRKFSTFFKSLCILLDQNLYGPDNHIVEWHRNAATQETDGFQVKRAGNKNVPCTIYFHLDHVPPKFKLDPRLARLLGIHTATRSRIVYALWTYIKTHRLQDDSDRNTIRCDPYLEQIFGTQSIRFNELPSRLMSLQHPPDPITIHHLINVEDNKPGGGCTMAYDIDVELEDAYKMMASNFLQNIQNNQEIQAIDEKIFDLVDQINQVKVSRQFYQEFSEDPREFITRWVMSQSQDLKSVTETGDAQCPSEAERRADFYAQPWVQEGVMRYLHNKLNQRRLELEQALGLGN